MAKYSKLVVDTNSRIHHDEGTGNQLIQKVSGTERKNGGIVRLVAKAIGTWAEGMDNCDANRVGNIQLDRLGFNYVARSKNAVIANPTRTVWNRVEEVPRPMDNIESLIGGKEKAKQKEGDREKGGTHEEKDREEKSQGKDKDKNKEKSRGENEAMDKEKSRGKNKGEEKERRQWKYKGREKEKLKDEKVKQSGENGKIENGELRKSDKNHFSYIRDMHPLHLPKDADSGAAEEKIRKRKEIEENGLLHGECRFTTTLHSTRSNTTIAGFLNIL